MNILVLVFAALAMVGALDVVLGQKLGFAELFLNGLDAMGKLCFSMCGIYCGATLAGRFLAQTISSDSAASLPLFASMVLATDMGGWAISSQMSPTPQQAWFSGILVASTLGCLISFTLPISLGGLDKQHHTSYLQGVSKGIAPLPFALAVGGLMCGIPIPALLWELLPIVILCVGLLLVLRFAPNAGLFVLKLLGTATQILGGVLFCVMAIGRFVPQWQWIGQDLFLESLGVVFNITVVVCGALIASGLLMRFGSGLVQKSAKLLQINEYAVAGLLASLISSVSMLPMYDKMNEKGKQMNAAFSVCGAFVLGGQMAFVADTTPSQALLAFFVCKAVGGILALLLVRKTKEKTNECC